MNKTSLFLALILLNIFLISCSSDDNSETQEPEPEPTFTNKLVKTEKVNDNFKSDYTYTENILTLWTGTRNNLSYELNFVYDSNGFLTENHYQETGTGTYSSDTFFNYDVNGNLISYDDVNLFYNGNLITATGTIEGNQNTTIELETNSSGLISKLSETDNYTLFEYDSDGNLVVAENYNN